MSEASAITSPVASPEADAKPLIELDDLKVWFHLREGVAQAVDGVSYSIARGHTLGVVGESGCGKSVTALALLGLVPEPGRVESGRILFNGKDLLTYDERAMRKIRGNRISMIFQEPMTALNPVYTVGAQVAEALRLHRGMSRNEARAEAVAMLDKVRIPSPGHRARDYPHQMSGGMRQRVMIAMALACDPDLLIADEPTTALDVTVQAQILELMAELRETTNAAVQLITHDLGVVSEVADHVVVMYAGMVVESASTAALFASPAHPYTLGLLRSIPKLSEIREGRALVPIDGAVPSPAAWPAGCRFHPRCPYAKPECSQSVPALEVVDEPGHEVRCFFSEEIRAGL